MNHQPASRPILQAVQRGVRCRCPRCGVGSLYDRYLKPTKACQTCGEGLDHIRTDDFAPWLTCLVLSHLMIPAIFIIDSRYEPDLLMQLVIWAPTILALAMVLLPHTKGVCLGLMWALRLRGDERHDEVLNRPAGH